MDAALANQITSLTEARALITELRNEFQQSLAALQTENQLLRQKLALFFQRYFGGTKNERLDPKQLELLLAGLEALSAPTPVAEQKTPARATAAARPVRQPLPAHLVTERVVLEPAEVQQQPAGWRQLGKELTEERGTGLEAGEIYQTPLYPAQVCQRRSHRHRATARPFDREGTARCRAAHTSDRQQV